MKHLVKIYGERNTNTNYLSKLLKLNLCTQEILGVLPRPVRILQIMSPSRELVRDLYFKYTYKYNLGWKHTRVKNDWELNKIDLVKNNNISFLTLTKNPYSWIVSLYRKPYHQVYEKKPAFEEFLVTPWKTMERDNCEKQVLDNPIELWNIKNSSFFNLASYNCLNLTTETLIENPKLMIDKISSHFSIPKKSKHFLNVENSAKRGGKRFEDYRDYYLNELWRKDLSQNAISVINDQLDMNLLQQYGYRKLQYRLP